MHFEFSIRTASIAAHAAHVPAQRIAANSNVTLLSFPLSYLGMAELFVNKGVIHQLPRRLD